MVEYEIPAMIHVSTSVTPVSTHGAHYLISGHNSLHACLTSDLFKFFPNTEISIPHGGGAVPYHWGRFGSGSRAEKALTQRPSADNIFFDTCVYHTRNRSAQYCDSSKKRIVCFGMVGAVRGIDPETGHNYDDTKALHRKPQNSG